MGNEEIGIPETDRAEISTGTLLFLGYSLEDWDFRTLFKGTVEQLERYEMYRSFAIQVNPSELLGRLLAQRQEEGLGLRHQRPRVRRATCGRVRRPRPRIEGLRGD